VQYRILRYSSVRRIYDNENGFLTHFSVQGIITFILQSLRSSESDCIHGVPLEERGSVTKATHLVDDAYEVPDEARHLIHHGNMLEYHQ
jgi:hypothetical protein